MHVRNMELVHKNQASKLNKKLNTTSCDIRVNTTAQIISTGHNHSPDSGESNLMLNWYSTNKKATPFLRQIELQNYK